MSFRVIVIGAGLGGLALGQGLRRRGVDVAVYERDTSPTDRLQGYRLHINTDGSRALHACLPPDLFAAFVATCGQPNTGIGIYTHRLRELAWFEADPASAGDPVDGFKSASRISLRQVLLTGLDDAVHFDHRFTRYEVLDGRVIAHFANGDPAIGDVLVGADGGSSRVRRQYLPQADRIETGMTGLQGKVWLTDEIRALLPERLVNGPIMVPGPGGYGMFLALHEFQPIPSEVSRLIGRQVADQRDYVMWGLLARRTSLPAALESLDPSGLRNLAANAIRDWHPILRRLVDASDLDTMLLTPIRSAAPVDPWPATPITLLGDAIHSMPPTGGIGANTALRDAALLSRQLASAAQGRVHPVDAIAAYESDMRRYGFDAVAASMRNLRRQQRTRNPLALAALKVALRTLGAMPAVRRRTLT